jgi:hypothetical protein
MRPQTAFAPVLEYGAIVSAVKHIRRQSYVGIVIVSMQTSLDRRKRGSLEFREICVCSQQLLLTLQSAAGNMGIHLESGRERTPELDAFCAFSLAWSPTRSCSALRCPLPPLIGL